MSAGSIGVTNHEGGWLVSSDEAPIGFIATDRSIVTPSGATYSVQHDTDSVAIVAANAQPVVSLVGMTLRDEKTGVEWQLNENWRSAFKNEVIPVDEVWGRQYSIEEAQGTVPNRVKLLLAWLVTQPEA